MLRLIDNLLNRIPIYRLMLYFLFILIVVLIVFCFTGALPYSGWDLMFSTGILTIVSLIVNKLFAAIFRVSPNGESDYITAWILALIITPGADWKFLILAASIAQASKYLLAYRGKHLFNPAAIAVLITFFTIQQGASWWIGSIYILPIVVIGGLLVARKTQRFDLVLSYLAAVIVTVLLNYDFVDLKFVFRQTFVNSSVLYFAFVMLPEPQTMPPTRKLRIVYGVLVGFLSTYSFSIGRVFTSPELALVLGNIFSFIVSPKGRLSLILKSKSQIANGIYSFVFEPNRQLSFQPGQYLEWTVPAQMQKTDSRGNRRYFTLASSPTETQIQLGVRFYEQPSSFKQKLLSFHPGDKILAGQLAGEFTLPKDHNKMLVFIAGGIGITPFRSMIKYLIDKNEKRDIVLFYSNKTEDEIAYKNILDEAVQKLGIKVIYVNTEKTGRLSAEMIKREVGDLSNRLFYISGSRGMVVAFEQLLRSLGIPKRLIKVDFFPGFA